MIELLANLQEDIDLLLYDREPDDIEKKISTDIAKAISLLKEQEAVGPDSEHHLFVCPVCRSILRRSQKFCHECGKRIEWKGR